MLRKTIAAAAIATVMGGVGATTAQASSYTLPNGTRITSSTPTRVAHRTTATEFRTKYTLRAYTLPTGKRITTTGTYRVAQRSTLQEFRAKYGR